MTKSKEYPMTYTKRNADNTLAVINGCDNYDGKGNIWNVWLSLDKLSDIHGYTYPDDSFDRLSDAKAFVKANA